MKEKIVKCMLSICTVICFILMTHPPKVNATIDNSVSSEDYFSVNLDVGITLNNRTMVPIREISNELGASVEWDASTKTITIVNSSVTLVLKLNSNTATINGKQVKFDAPPKVINGKTFVPLRLISESFGAIVEWDGSENVASIITSKKEIYVITHPYFEINGVGFVYDGEMKNGLPHGKGTGIKGTSRYGEILHDGLWDKGKPVKKVNNLTSNNSKKTDITTRYYTNTIEITNIEPLVHPLSKDILYGYKIDYTVTNDATSDFAYGGLWAFEFYDSKGNLMETVVGGNNAIPPGKVDYYNRLAQVDVRNYSYFNIKQFDTEPVKYPKSLFGY